MAILKTFRVFIITAVAEIVSCYLSYFDLKHGCSAWLLVTTAPSLAAFAWLLTLRPRAAFGVHTV